MLLILEILLTVRAWKNGWKALALVPDAVVLLVGFMIGASSSQGTSNDSMFAIGLLLDILNIVVLGIMSARAPRSAVKTAAAPAGINSAKRAANMVPVSGANEGPAMPVLVKGV